MSETTRVTEKGQTTIPKAMREKYDLDPGDEVRWEDTEDGIRLRKSSGSNARGMLVPSETPQDAREAIAEELEQRVAAHRQSIERQLDSERQ